MAGCTGRLWIVSVWLLASCLGLQTNSLADSHGDDLTQWINVRGVEVWGEPPEKCDDLTFARRVFIDVLGRTPSVAEIRDYEALSQEKRRARLVDQLVFGEGERRAILERQAAGHFARQWRQVLLPSGSVNFASANTIDAWLAQEYLARTPLDEILRRLIASDLTAASGGAGGTNISAGAAAAQYFQLLGGLPENYVGNLSRVMLGVRIECAQCHDHPFTQWKMQDFWGLAAFYSDMARRGDDAATSQNTDTAGVIRFNETSYRAKLLWTDQPLEGKTVSLRSQLSRWMTSPDNPNFASTVVNRVWQQMAGRGLFPDVENLDTASPAERQLLDEFGQRFAKDGFDVRRLTAAICKSNWYQAASRDEPANVATFYRPLKAISPEQVFDSMEQSLHLPISRIDPGSPRWTGGRVELISRLGESGGRTPEDYSAGIPQALLLMNGRLTEQAVSVETGRLLRAVVDSPFMNEGEQVETLYLALLSRRPTTEESAAIEQFLSSKSDQQERQSAMGKLVWALLNSPEFVLCR